MKQIKNRKIVNEIKTFEIHPDHKDITLKGTFENSKLKEAVLDIKKQPLTGHKLWPAVVTSAFWDLIKTTNPWWEVKGKFGWNKETCLEAKDLLEMEEVDPANIILYYGRGRLIFRTDMTPIPVPYGMDYIGTPNENTKIDLEGWLEDLKKNPMVINADELKIVEVPYYNNKSGRRKFISGTETPWITVLPDQETMNEMFRLGMERHAEFFYVEMKEILFGDWLRVLQDEKRGTKTAAPIDPLNVRKFLKKSDDIEF